LIIVDASVIAPALADDRADGERARDRLRGEQLMAPELLDLEVVSVIRKALLSGTLNQRRAGLAMADLLDLDLDLERVSHRPMLARIWQLREKLTPYDASYVALDDVINATLVTADRRLLQAPGLRCTIECLG
jgi:predicted nucleic acid-binding protein